jgi:hypothetical protein
MRLKRRRQALVPTQSLRVQGPDKSGVIGPASRCIHLAANTIELQLAIEIMCQ